LTVETNQLLTLLRRSPAIHCLYAGVFLQEPLPLADDLLITPLQPLGKLAEADFLASFSHMIGLPVPASSTHALAREAKGHRPVVAVSIFVTVPATVEQLEQLAQPRLGVAEPVLAWASANRPLPLGYVAVLEGHSHLKLAAFGEPVHRIRLGLSNRGEDFLGQIRALMTASETDENLAFALSLYRDAIGEQNPEFRIARYFACLEALAYRFKAGSVGSRNAVRQLFLPEVSVTDQIEHEGRTYSVDVIEIAGRLRDKLFHGVPFAEGGLRDDLRWYFTLLKNEPERLASHVAALCELELSRWAQGRSKGQAGA